MQTSKKAKTRRIYIGISTKICLRSAHIWPKELAPRGALLLWQIIVAPLGPIKAAHDASQVYVELANQTFKDDCTLSGENTDKLKLLEDARMYVDSSKNSS